MSYFEGPYLRVLTPVTSNGTNLVYRADGSVQYKEQHMPLSSRKNLEAKNRSLPEHLRHKIEIVDYQFTPQIQTHVTRPIEKVIKNTIKKKKAVKKPKIA